MSETALYRKYRPQAFKDVLGQEHVVRALEGAVKNGNFSHAYLFAGSRGTGKTSVARILADAIGVSPNDLHEIDAASNRGIDDIRELREAVLSRPFESPYKVYIIDEVHMLTKEAFNALLKTLEEPPAHVVFVLATTEADKLPDTIVSRCQHFTFKKPTQQMLRDVVQKVAKKEGYTIDAPSADLIALLGEGSFRDTQGILQLVLSATDGKKVKMETVETVTGAPKSELVNDVLTALNENNLEKALSAVAKAVSKHVDIRVFLKLLLKKARMVLLLRAAPELAKTQTEEFSQDDYSVLEKLAEEKSGALNSHALRALLDAYNQTGRAAVPQLPLELSLIEVIGKSDKE